MAANMASKQGSGGAVQSTTANHAGQVQNKQGVVWSQSSASQTVNNQYPKRQYNEAYNGSGKQPVVTMHELIDQEEKSKAQAQA